MTFQSSYAKLLADPTYFGFHREAQRRGDREIRISEKARKIINFWLYKYRSVGV